MHACGKRPRDFEMTCGGLPKKRLTQKRMAVILSMAAAQKKASSLFEPSAARATKARIRAARGKFLSWKGNLFDPSISKFRHPQKNRNKMWCDAKRLSD